MTRILGVVILSGLVGIAGCDTGSGDPAPGDAGVDAGNGDPGPGDLGPGDPGPGDPGPGDPGAGDPGGGDPGSGDEDCTGSCHVADLEVIGGFHAVKGRVDSPPGSGKWVGAGVYGIYDKPYPGHIFHITHHSMWEPSHAEGDCVYLTEIMPGFCTPPCSASEWCTPDDYCEALPVYRHAGTLTLSGLGPGMPTTLQPDGNGQYSYSSPQDDPDNAFTPANDVTLTAAGGPTPAFTLMTPGVDWISSPLDCYPDPQPGQDLIITWTPGPPGDAIVRFNMASYRHVGWGPTVLCEAQDTGSLTVPAAIVDRYLADLDPSNHSLALSRVSRAVEDIGDGRLVALELVALRFCTFEH